VKESLAGEGVRVVGPDGPLCEVWLRKAVPARSTPSGELGIAYPQMEEGTLVGAVRFLAAARDYRRQGIKPGTYTLRYSLHPVDGNHLGVAAQRDFLLLAPAVADTGTARVAYNDLMALSRRASGTNHPAIWSLVPPESESSEPGVRHREEEDHWVLLIPAQFHPEGGSALARTLAVVVVGAAPEA
jgi:hypothetical protein